MFNIGVSHATGYGRRDQPRSGRSLRNALATNQPSGYVRITHPFHPLRDQRFLVLKTRRVSGRQTLILQGAQQTTFGVPADWTDRAPPDPDVAAPTILHASTLQALAALVEQLLRPATETPQKGVAK